MPRPFFKKKELHHKTNGFILKIEVMAFTRNSDVSEGYWNRKTFNCESEQNILFVWKDIKDMIERSTYVLEKNNTNSYGIELNWSSMDEPYVQQKNEFIIHPEDKDAFLDRLLKRMLHDFKSLQVKQEKILQEENRWVAKL